MKWLEANAHICPLRDYGMFFVIIEGLAWEDTFSKELKPDDYKINKGG